MIAPALFSSESVEWATPPALFAKLAKRYGPFDLDSCATAENAKCARYFDREQDGLQQAWTGRCWCNPPYGRGIGRWVRKAWESSLTSATVVCLLPARPDTAWWQDYVLPYAEVEFLRGRVRFGGCVSGAPFPSAVVVFRPVTRRCCESCQSLYVPRRTDAVYCSAACRQAAYRSRRVTALSVTQGERPEATTPAAVAEERAAAALAAPAQEARGDVRAALVDTLTPSGRRPSGGECGALAGCEAGQA